MSGSVFFGGIARARAALVVFVAVMIAGFLALGMSAPASAVSPGTLNVRVSDRSGEFLTGLAGNVIAIPVINNEPDVADQTTGTEVTGIPGEYTFSLVPSQQYAIAILSATGGISELYGDAPVSGFNEGYFDSADLITVAGGGIEYLDFSVVSSVALKGTVTSTSGTKLRGIYVDAWRFDGSDWIEWQEGQTSSTGAYSLPGLDAGSYKLEFSDSSTAGYLHTFSGGASTLAEATATYIGVGGTATVNQKLAAGAKITGKVTYSFPDEVTSKNPTGTVGADSVVPFAYPVTTTGSGSSLAVAHVTPNVYYAGEDTSTSGTWTVAGLPTGTYIVKLDDDTPPSERSLVDAYVGPTGPVTSADAAKVFTATVGKTTTTGITTKLALVSGDTSTPFTLTVDDPSNAPLANAFVTLSPAGSNDNDYYFSSYLDGANWVDLTNAVTPASADDPAIGTVSFPRLPTGSYILTVDYSSGVDYGSSGYAPTYQPYVETLDYDGTTNSETVTMSPPNPLGFSGLPTISASSNLAAGVAHTVSATSNQTTGATVDYLWERDGKPIYGATDAQYTPQGGDIGHLVSVLITVTKNGFNPIAETATLGTIIVGPAIASATAPVITSSTATPTVGSTLSASTGIWTASSSPLAGVKTTTNWYLSSDGYAGIIATGPTYVVTAAEADAHDSIEAKVFADKPGYGTSPQVATNQLSISPAPAATATKAPKVTSKKATGGTQYTVSTGTWSATGLSYHYQWTADGVTVGSDSHSYLRPTSGVTSDLYVTVTAARAGYLDGTARVRAAAGLDSPRTSSPRPAVTDERTSADASAGVEVGDALSVASVQWSYPDGSTSTTSTYQWYRSKSGGAIKAISKATGSTYTVVSGDVGYLLSVTAKSTDTDYAPGATTGVGGAVTASTALVDAAPEVNIEGTFAAGGSLTATVDSWGVTGVTQTYQWFACNPSVSDCSSPTASDIGKGKAFAPISKATKLTLATTQSMLNDEILLQVKGTKAGYTSYTSSSPVVGLPTTQPVATKAATLKTSTASFTVTPPNWKPTGGTLEYTFFANGSPVQDSSSPILARNSSYTGKLITVEIDYTGSGFDAATSVLLIQKGAAPAAATTAADPIVSSRGADIVGSTLSLTSNPFTYPVTPDVVPVYHYQWYVGSTAVKASAGGTAASFTPPASDVNKAIKVKETATDAQWASATFTSASVTLAPATVTVVAAITGTPKPGVTLSVNTTSYPSGTTLSFVWSFLPAGGSSFAAISKATKSSYVVLAAQAGGALKVTVTAKKTGYLMAPQSPLVTVQYGSPLTATASPSITGTAAVGSTLTVGVGTWNTTGLTFGYQWQLNGIDIPGATAATFTPIAGDYRDDITATVAASKPGYQPASATSQEILVDHGTIAAPTTAPKISSTTNSALLIASTGVWSVDGLTFTYQWYLNGSAIDGATQGTWAPASAGSYTVKVTARRFGYADSAAVTSAGIAATTAP